MFFLKSFVPVFVTDAGAVTHTNPTVSMLVFCVCVASVYCYFSIVSDNKVLLSLRTMRARVPTRRCTFPTSLMTLNSRNATLSPGRPSASAHLSLSTLSSRAGPQGGGEGVRGVASLAGFAP